MNKDDNINNSNNNGGKHLPYLSTSEYISDTYNNITYAYIRITLPTMNYQPQQYSSP